MNEGGNAWFGKGSSAHKIEPGDVIVVPIDLKQTKFLENLTYGTQIIYQLTVAAAAVIRFRQASLFDFQSNNKLISVCSKNLNNYFSFVRK